MVLTELSTNHIARKGNFNAESRFPGRDPFAVRRSTPTVLPTHHNTVKTAVEAGDTGPLSSKQSRLPHPVARISPRKYRSTFDLAATDDATFVPPIPDLGRYAATQGETVASWGMNMSTASSIISMYGRESPNNPRTAFQTSDQEYRSFSMTQGLLTPAGLSNHRSFSSLRDPRVLGTPTRPRSPFTYPTRLKRPGFKPPSPTPSDAGGADIRSTAGLERSLSSGTSSPPSPHQRNRLPEGEQELNRPVLPLLVIPPQSTHPRRRSRGKLPSSRVATQVIASVSSPDHLRTLTSGSNARICRSAHYSASKQLTPLYYDYTEAFEDDEFSLNGSSSSFPFLAIDGAIPENGPLINGSNAEKDVQEVTEKHADAGDYEIQLDHSEPARSPSGDMGGAIITNPTTTNNRREESPNGPSHVKSFGSLDIGVPSDTRTISNGAGVHGGLEYHLTQSSNAYPPRNPNRNCGNLDIHTSSISQNQSAICHQGPEIREGTGIYTRLSAHRRDRRLSVPGELHAEEVCEQGGGKRQGMGATEPFCLGGGGTALERSTSSYSRRSSIRRFFSSDQGFEDMPEITTAFKGIDKPYTPDQSLLGDAEAQYSHTKDSNCHIKRPDTTSIDSSNPRHSRSAADGENARNSGKLTNRSSKERDHEIHTAIGDISTINSVPQTRPISRGSRRRKRRFSSTAQGDPQVAMPGPASANLMKQLPQLPMLQSREPVLFPMPPSTMPIGEPPANALSAESGIPAAMGYRGFVAPAGGGANEDSVCDSQSTPTAPQDISHSPLSHFSTSVEAPGGEEPQRVNLAHETTAPQKFKVGPRPLLTDHRALESFSPVDFESSGSGPGLAPKASFVAGEAMKKVSFQEARQNPANINSPKAVLRSSVVPTSRPHKPVPGISKGETQSEALDRDVSDSPLSSGCASGGQFCGPEAREVTSPERLSTSSDNNSRGRSSNIGPNPTLRHANPSEPRSVFSDDSSQITTNRNAIKRLTNLKAKLPILSASRRSKDGPGISDRAAVNLTVARPKKKVRIQSPRRAMGLCEARYKVKKLASMLGSWFHRRRERSRVVFRGYRSGVTPVGKAGVMYPGV